MRLIKGARHHRGQILGPGYVLLGTEDANDGQVIYRLPLLDHSTGQFVFGFQGVGSHFLAKVCQRHGLIAVYCIQDGIPVYLNHVLVRLPENSILEILHDVDFISITCSGYALINVLHDGNAAGDWGFAVAKRSRLSLPRVEIAHRSRSDSEWIVLGDGFSNNRWSNRHFVSWPELLFGTNVSYLNACVAAANSGRVLAVSRKLAPRMRNANVIVSMGTDDLIEGHGLGPLLHNAERLVNLLAEAGTRNVWMTNLPPVNFLEPQLSEWNEALSQHMCKFPVTLVDIHSLLMRNQNSYMAQGNYPSSDGQWLIAQHFATLIGGLHPQRPDIILPKRSLMSKVAMHLSSLFARASSDTISFTP